MSVAFVFEASSTFFISSLLLAILSLFVEILFLLEVISSLAFLMSLSTADLLSLIFFKLLPISLLFVALLSLAFCISAFTAVLLSLIFLRLLAMLFLFVATLLSVLLKLSFKLLISLSIVSAFLP